MQITKPRANLTNTTVKTACKMSFTTQHRTAVIIFRLNIQTTVTIALMTSTGRIRASQNEQWMLIFNFVFSLSMKNKKITLCIYAWTRHGNHQCREGRVTSDGSAECGRLITAGAWSDARRSVNGSTRRLGVKYHLHTHTHTRTYTDTHRHTQTMT